MPERVRARADRRSVVLGAVALSAGPVAVRCPANNSTKISCSNPECLAHPECLAGVNMVITTVSKGSN